MALFIAAADESAGKDERSLFHYGGLIMPEPDWTTYFVPAWDDRVLKGPPRIPYLHMTDIRSPRWRESHGLTLSNAERRIDEAFRVIASMGSAYLMTQRIDGATFHSALSTVKMHRERRAPRRFEPDYMGFLGFAITSLEYASQNEDCEQVDFVVERKESVIAHIQEFHDELKKVLDELGRGDLARLVGELIPGGKERTPLQAADLICWYEQRRNADQLSDADSRRYLRLARCRGNRHEWARQEFDAFSERAERAALSGELQLVHRKPSA